MICGHYEPLWLRILKIPIFIIIFPFALINLALFKQRKCSKCYGNIWRFQESVREEKPFICSDGNNYPWINLWHIKCYKEKIE